MKVLVTGVTGFIGNYVVTELIKQGIEVVATSRDITKAKSKDWFANVNYIEADINKNIENWYEFFCCPDSMIHLAWDCLSNFKDSKHYEVVLPFHYRFLKNIITNGLNDLTITGTCLEYGIQYGELSEDVVSNPVTAYGLSKDCLNKYILQLKYKLNLNYKWVRLFYMYGEGQNPNSLLSQLKLAIKNGDKEFNMSKGDQLRDFLPVEKVSQNLVRIALQNKIQGIINCCSGIPTSVRSIVEYELQKSNYKMNLNLGYYQYPDYEPIAFWGSPSKLKKIMKKSK